MGYPQIWSTEQDKGQSYPETKHADRGNGAQPGVGGTGKDGSRDYQERDAPFVEIAVAEIKAEMEAVPGQQGVAGQAEGHKHQDQQIHTENTILQ